MIPLYEFGGSGPVMHLAVANGFPPPVYTPLVQPFTAHYRVVSLMPRPLWPGGPPPDSIRSWRDLAADLLEGLRQHNLRNIVAVGHSLGGVLSVLAARAEPERFRALVLLDPTFMPPATLAALRVTRVLGLAHRLPIVQGALRRRRHFDSAEQAFAHWRRKAFFADWPDEALRLYAAHGTRPRADGPGVELTWPREWEARVFQTIPLDVWREARGLRSLNLPLLVIRGEHTNTFRPASERAMRRYAPSATYHILRGHGHLFPMSAAEQAAGIIAGWLQGLAEQGR